MIENIGKVHSLNISIEKGTVKKPVDSIIVNKKGIEGDAHAGNWHRQISLLSQERINEFACQMSRLINPGEFAENITTVGLDLRDVTVLDRFIIGDVELEVTQLGKKCHGNGCAIFQEIGKCVMPHEGVFCRVINGGKIFSGDIVEYSQIPLKVSVVTVSDRASSGEYEDRSGPEIVKLVNDFFHNKTWSVKCSVSVVPDEIEQIRNAVSMAAVNSDIILTTGGTGVGSRDVTPEAVNPLIEKEITGIMEFIRCKYGAGIPNALISRATAGTIGDTLIYTLPGSVKAVREYMEEILKTVEHTIFMLKGINTH